MDATNRPVDRRSAGRLALERGPPAGCQLELVEDELLVEGLVDDVVVLDDVEESEDDELEESDVVELESDELLLDDESPDDPDELEVEDELAVDDEDDFEPDLASLR